jgi:CHAD domain-containing protein
MLRSTDSMSLAGAMVMGRYWQQASKRQRDVREDADPEAVHDMRVAVRRLRVAFTLFERWYEARELRGFRRALRRLGRRLGEVRDGEVLLENARAAAGQLPNADLAGLIARWDADHAAARVRLLEYFDGPEFASFRRRFEAFVEGYQSSEEPAVSPAEDGDSIVAYLVCDVMPAEIWKQYGAVHAYDPIAAEAPAPTLHRLRIAGKQLRYAIESFDELTGKAGDHAVRALREMQDILGALHDAHVAIDLIQAFQTMQAGPSDVVEPYIAHQREAIGTARAQFDLLWPKIAGQTERALVAKCAGRIAGMAETASEEEAGAAFS